jgi:hypothetical protein
MASGSAAPVLQSLPHEVLLHIAASAPWATPEQLLGAGGLCRALRAAVGCPSVVQLRPLWARAIIALVDPCAALARAADVTNGEGLGDAYAPHAAAHARAGSPGWFALAHALAQRKCVACGVVTPWVAWRVRDEAAATTAHEPQEAARRNALCRCCESCAPPQHAPPFRGDAHHAGDDHAAASSEGASDASEESESEDEDDEDDADDEDYMPDFHRCTVINAQFFEPQPRIVLDASALPSPEAALRAAVVQAHDGDTIGLRGEFVMKHSLFMGGGTEAVIRLLGLPASAPYRNVHASANNAGWARHGAWATGGGGWDALGDVERTAAAAVAFPAVSIVLKKYNFLAATNPAWLESLFIRSGNTRRPPRITAENCCAVMAHTFEVDVPPPSLVLRRCWVSACSGAGVAVSQYAAVALLRCCITNSHFAPVFCQSDTTLRMRGCHVLWNGRRLGVGNPADDDERRVVRVNVFVPHPLHTNNTMNVLLNVNEPPPAGPFASPVEPAYRALTQDVLLLD